jgi:hypothetical protein
MKPVIVVEPPALNPTLPHTSQSPAVRETEVMVLAVAVVKEVAEPLASVPLRSSPTLPLAAESLVAVPTTPVVLENAILGAVNAPVSVPPLSFRNPLAA